MLVVGGSYAEHCETPPWHTTQGSGMRASGALSAQGARLLTALDDELGPDAELVANAIGLQRDVVERSGPVGFEYFTPLSTPRVVGTKTVAQATLRGEDDAALVFGMLEEADFDVRAKRMVYDPQRPGSGHTINLDGLQFDELALVLNAGEARAFGGRGTIEDSVSNLFATTLANTIVVKGGASGCSVFTRRGPQSSRVVSAFPTPSVWPLGSGDTFAAGFAHAWTQGADAQEAARIGSASAAYWCSTQSPVLPDNLLLGDAATLPDLALVPLPDTTPSTEPPMVYLAGPFFSLGEHWLVDLVRAALTAHGVRVFSPLHDVGHGDESVALADIEGLKKCSSVIALLDGSDFGTVYEAGWAERAGIPVVGYASRPDKEGAKMLTGLGGELHTDLSTAVYRAAWRAMGAPGLTSSPSEVAEKS